MEDALTNSYGELMSRDYATGTSLVISSVCSTVHMADIYDPDNLPAMLPSKVRVSAMTVTLGTKQGRENWMHLLLLSDGMSPMTKQPIWCA